MEEGVRYVLQNGLVTLPLKLEHREGRESRASAGILGRPYALKHWKMDGTAWRGPGCGWDIVKVFDVARYPTELKLGARYFYVDGGLSQPLDYRSEEGGFGVFMTGHQWDKFGKNLDFNGRPDEKKDLIVALPLYLRVGLDETDWSL